MKVCSWNMWFRNPDLDGAFDFIARSQADIFCLQEVPSDFLPRLKSLPYHLAQANDVDRLFDIPKRNHVVILSKYAIVNQGTIPFPNYWPTLPLRAKLWVKMLRPWGWSKIANRHGLWADLQTPAGIVRVFCLHLVLATVDMRLSEFDLAMEERDPSLPTIVCGDFNTIESRRVSLINWVLGGTFRDIFDTHREREALHKCLVQLHLHNPLSGSITHSFGGSQFDHILVPDAWQVEKSNVILDRHGSDHNPIHVTVRTPAT